MKKWIVLAFIATLISSGLHFYLTKRTYQLIAGTAQTSTICNINEKVNCDIALLSPYAKIFNVSLSSFGFGFNISLSLILLFFLFGFFKTPYWKSASVYLSGFVAFCSLIMVAVSFFKNLYCPICWTTYFLSFLALGSLFWVFRREVFERSFVKFILDSIREKNGIYLGSFVFIISFFLHMVFVTSYGIKDNKKQFEALLLDWKHEEVLSFSKPPLLKLGPTQAKITIVEFADFLCPSCKRVQPSIKDFLKIHPDIAFHFYTFPLDKTCNDEIDFKGTGVTCTLSRAAICGEQQGQGWAVHDFLFREQESFRNNQANKSKITELIKNMLQVVDLDSQKFFSCMESSETKRMVQEMAELGAKAHIPGTPTFFINGKLLTGFSNHLLAFLNYIYDHIN